MRDPETIDTAMKAAETGHLLVSTLHTPDATTTITRVMAMFPPEEQEIVRMRLAESLYAVISQRLLPRADGKGRVVAAEVMINTPTIRDLILDPGRVNEIRDYIAQGREQYGMQTFDQHLMDLVSSEEVTFEVAHAASTRPSDFELQVKTFRRNTTSVKAATVAAPAPVPAAAEKAKEPSPTTTLDGLTSGTGYDFM
jgi:twitching motility protein PilT